MTAAKVSKLPVLVYVAIALTFYNSFVLLEEFVIDRYGLAEHLPLYTVGHFCTWDVAALLFIIGGLWGWRIRNRRHEAEPTTAS